MDEVAWSGSWDDWWVYEAESLKELAVATAAGGGRESVDLFPSSTIPDEYREDGAVLMLDREEFIEDFDDMSEALC